METLNEIRKAFFEKHYSKIYTEKRFIVFVNCLYKENIISEKMALISILKANMFKYSGYDGKTFENLSKEEFTQKEYIENSKLTNDKIIETWKKVFPNSMIVKGTYTLSGGHYFKGFLAKDASEFANGYQINSVLHYDFEIEGGIYKENEFCIFIKPDNNYMAYGRAKRRRKSIKNVTAEKLEKRFLELKQLIVENKDNFINLEFDINDKI